MSSFADLFDATDVVDWKGHEVQPVLRFPVAAGSMVRVRRLGSSSERAQAVKLAVDQGAMRLARYEGSSIALWSHSAPAEVELEIIGHATVLEVWNAWSLDGVDNAWLGNAGIIAESHANGWTLQCSDGVGDPDFSDLVLWLGIIDVADATWLDH